MILLGADVGTTRIKAVAYCADRRRVIAAAERATPVERTPDGDAHDCDRIYQAVLACLSEIIEQVPERADVAAIAVASLGEEVVLIDEGGAPLIATPTWYESPGQVYADEYPRRVNRTFSLFLLRWFAEHRTAAAAAAVAFTDIGSYVAARLAGLAAPVMDHSHASRTGFFDVRTRSFLADGLAWAGDWTAKAPRLVPSGSVIGRLGPRTAHQLGLSGSVAVVAGAHDHFAAAFASGVREPGDAMLSAGTSEALLVLTDSVPSDVPDDVDLGAFVDERTFYLHRNARAGHLFGRWREMLHLTVPAPSWFEPPVWEPDGRARAVAVIDADRSTATLAAVHFDAGPVDILRTLSEGLAVNARRMLAGIEAAAGRPVATLTVAGPAGDQDAWLRMRADVLDRALRVVRTPEPTALGAALLAQRGICGTADLPVETDVVEPSADPAARRYYADLLDAYGRAARVAPA